MTLYVYDMAYEQDPATVKANGGIAMARYFVGNQSGYQWKRVTPAQVQQIRAAGLGVVVNYEGSADPIGSAKPQGIPLRTYGQNEAKAALVDIQACGIPRDGTVACYFSLDDNYGSANFADIEELFRGHHDVMDPARIQVKAYGDGAALKHLISVGLVVGKQWLAAPSSWPGFDPNDDADFCMVQLVGSPVSGTDQNIVHSVTDAKAIAAWWPANSPYDPPAPGFLMALTDQQQLDLYNRVTDLHNWLTGDLAPGTLSVADEVRASLNAIRDTFTNLNADQAQATQNYTNIKNELDQILSKVSGGPPPPQPPPTGPVSGTYTFSPPPTT